MTVRSAVVADLDFIVELLSELAEYEQLSGSLSASREDLQQHLFGKDAAAQVLIAEDRGEVVGYALWFRTFSSFLGKPGIWLEDLFVRPAHRGRGHGAALLQAVRSATEGRVEWSVLDWNETAIEFYRTLGAAPLDGWTIFRWPPSRVRSAPSS